MTLIRKLLLSGGLAVIALSLACGGGGGGDATLSGSSPTTNVFVVDAPSDTWSTVQVQVTHVALRNAADHTTTVVFSGAASINLVDLDSLGELLTATTALPANTSYDQATVTVNPDPSTITLIPAGGGVAVASNLIEVIGNSITVDLSAAPLAVQTTPANGSNAVQLDFNLADPVFINQTPGGNVVVNFSPVKHKPSPVHMSLIQLHRSVGTVASTSIANSTLTITKAGQPLTFTTDGSTLFYDTDSHPATAGSLGGMAAGNAVMVASRLQDNGTLYAIRVWYCSPGTNATRPVWWWSPEGHVSTVNTTADTMIVDNADGTPRHVSITAGTAFTYQRNTALGTGTAFLANVKPGFKVSIDVVDPLASPLVATSVNIERAVDGGYIDTATAVGGITYGQVSLNNLRTYPFGSGFSWWDFEQPATASTVITGGFLSALQGAGTTRVNGASDLTWDTTNLVWDANTAILMPVPLPKATITTAYTVGTGTMVISYRDPLTSLTTAQTITLSPTAGGGQTVVLLVTPQASVVSSQLDAPANWATDLTPLGTTNVWVAEVPTATGLDAYSVVALVAAP
jgi:hypothetical protein